MSAHTCLTHHGFQLLVLQFIDFIIYYLFIIIYYFIILAFIIVHSFRFFCLYLLNKSSESKEKLSQASNRCQRVHEFVKLACANKTKESITTQKLGSRDF